FLVSPHRSKLNMRRDRNRLSPKIPNILSSHIIASGPAHVVFSRSTIHHIRLHESLKFDLPPSCLRNERGPSAPQPMGAVQRRIDPATRPSPNTTGTT